MLYSLGAGRSSRLLRARGPREEDEDDDEEEEEQQEREREEGRSARK